MQIELAIGAGRYALGEEDAWELVHAIRERCIDGDHRPLDSDALLCLQLADALAEDLDRDEPAEPIPVEQAHARVLTEYVLTPSVMRTDDMRALFEALVRAARGRY